MSPSSPGYLNLYLWEGDYSTYAQAAAAGAAVGTTGVFAQAVVFGITPGPWLSMPDVLLQPVPEPSTLLLAAAACLACWFTPGGNGDRKEVPSQPLSRGPGGGPFFLRPYRPRKMSWSDAQAKRPHHKTGKACIISEV